MEGLGMTAIKREYDLDQFLKLAGDVLWACAFSITPVELFAGTETKIVEMVLPICSLTTNSVANS